MIIKEFGCVVTVIVTEIHHNEEHYNRYLVLYHDGYLTNDIYLQYLIGV